MLILHEFPDKILSMPLKLVRNSFNRKKNSRVKFNANKKHYYGKSYT